MPLLTASRIRRGADRKQFSYYEKQYLFAVFLLELTLPMASPLTVHLLQQGTSVCATSLSLASCPVDGHVTVFYSDACVPYSGRQDMLTNGFVRA